jgi:hypothetical protein
MPYVEKGQKATLAPAYSPGETYTGKIEHIYSHLGSIRYVPEAGTEVRTMKVRFELPNPGHRLKLGMYLNVELPVRIADSAVAVPDSALIDSGERQVIIIDRRDGTFEPREVKAGAKADGWFQVLHGVEEGEWVVTSANFLIDSESKLKSAIAGMAAHRHGDGGAFRKEGTAPAGNGAPSEHDHPVHDVSPGRSGHGGADPHEGR